MFYNPYEVLGVDSSMSLDEIQKVYRRLAKRHHPDSPNGDGETFIRINQAWETIKSYKSGGSSGTNRVKRKGFVTHKTLFTFRRI